MDRMWLIEGEIFENCQLELMTIIHAATCIENDKRNTRASHDRLPLPHPVCNNGYCMLTKLFLYHNEICRSRDCERYACREIKQLIHHWNFCPKIACRVCTRILQEARNEQAEGFYLMLKGADVVNPLPEYMQRDRNPFITLYPTMQLGPRPRTPGLFMPYPMDFIKLVDSTVENYNENAGWRENTSEAFRAQLTQELQRVMPPMIRISDNELPKITEMNYFERAQHFDEYFEFMVQKINLEKTERNIEFNQLYNNGHGLEERHPGLYQQLFCGFGTLTPGAWGPAYFNVVSRTLELQTIDHVGVMEEALPDILPI